MSISALTSSSASQLSFMNRLSSASPGNGADNAIGAPPPPPPGGGRDGGGFIEAIANALKEIGVTGDGSTSSAGSTSTVVSTTGTASASGSDSTDSTDNVAQALGSFLQSLMGALHAQSSESSSAPPPYGAEGGQGGPGIPGGPGGPGKLETDLQSLISKLGSGSASTGTDSVTSDLESSFKNLLDKLSGTTSDSTDANKQLASFLQALSNGLQGNGTSGNLINTTV